MRRQGASIFIYVIFGILILVFIINFRPGGQQGDDSGCTGTNTSAITVDGHTINQTSYKVNFGAFNGPTMARTYRALENLIRREILVSDATDRGILASDDLILDRIKQGYFYMGGQGEILKELFREDGTWDYTRYKGFVQNQFNVSLNSFQDEQRRELQAALMAQEIEDSVRVSREEAQSEWTFDNNVATFDAVVFKPDAYKTAMHPTDDDYARFAKDHEAEVKARFNADATLYKGRKAELKLREIFIAKSEPAGSGAGSAGSAAPAGMTDSEAKAKLEAARTAIAGGKAFADYAKDLNTDADLKAKAGDLGWRSADSAAIGDKPVTDAIKTLKPGEMTPVITTDKGSYLVIATDKREGDLTLEQVKTEIAAQLAPKVWAQEAAKRAALDALAQARSGTGKSLDQVFQRDENDQLPEEVKQILKANPGLDPKQVLDQLRQIKQRGTNGDGMPPPPPPDDGGSAGSDGPHGELEVHGPDHPAAWYADGDGPSGSGMAAESPAGSAGSSTPAKGSATAKGSAATMTTTTTTTKTGSAGSAGGTASVPAAGSAAPAADLKPSDDKLPAMDAVAPPKVSEQGPTPRVSKLPGVGGKDIMDAVFDELSPGNLGKRVYAGEDGSYVLIQLKTRASVNVTDFDKQADHVIAELRHRRAEAAVVDYLKNRCETLAKANRIKPNPEYIREHDDQGNPLPSGYHPCMSFALQPGAGGPGE
nr:peptidylprolyl isomerase [Kofleriaceae bacterium]